MHTLECEVHASVEMRGLFASDAITNKGRKIDPADAIDAADFQQLMDGDYRANRSLLWSVINADNAFPNIKHPFFPKIAKGRGSLWEKVEQVFTGGGRLH